jgi:hypothetical protein
VEWNTARGHHVCEQQHAHGYRSCLQFSYYGIGSNDGSGFRADSRLGGIGNFQHQRYDDDGIVEHRPIHNQSSGRPGTDDYFPLGAIDFTGIDTVLPTEWF